MIRECKLDGCSNTFEVSLGNKRSSRRMYCGPTCTQHDKPAYKETSERVRTVVLYMSLGFTPEQVYKDFIEGEVNPVSFLKQLERRNETKAARLFRRWLKDIGTIKPRRHNAARAA